MTKKKIPMRKCVVTNERFEKKQLLRVVKTPEGKVIFDKTGKANGRGAYVSKSKAVIEKAKKTKILAKHLETDIPESVYENLLKWIENE
ncbi:RNase P modulator RnpM [Candidatus Izemoplasma sp. B36]|uniref:RNase P modulator RnpM n=1 Tax=Candidatus Izemoplasma sp. B36 TaxID=3242468 RepID=UPI003557D2A9